MSKKSKLTLWERYLTKEIGIEFKACLYFFAILFFYCMYRLVLGIFDAGMLHMAEMILAAYIIGYLQVYVFWNFDEADTLGGREWLGLGVCTVIYSLLSYFLKWFDKNIWVTVGFAAYVVIMYVCVFFIYKSKRHIDDKKLNEDLRLFQAGTKKVQDKDE